VAEKVGSYGFPECGEPYSWEKDTIISVTYGETDTTLFVLGREIWLDSTGVHYAYHFNIRLWNDSLNAYNRIGGLGCGRVETHEGYRVSDKP
jgi:hypothetical protein